MFDSYDFLDSLSDAELAALEMGGGGGLDPYLFPMLDLIEPLPVQYSTAKWNFGAQQPYSIDTYAKQNNAFQDDLQILSNPMFAMLGDPLGMYTMDYSQFVPQVQTPPQPVVFTPTLDSLRMDEATADIAAMIEQGMPLSTVRSAIREADISSEETRQDLLKDAERAWAEAQNAQRSMLEYQQQAANAPQQLTPMQIAAQRAGLPDPLAQWGDERYGLPPEVDLSGFGDEEERIHTQALNDLRRLQRTFASESNMDARDFERTSPGAGVSVNTATGGGDAAASVMRQLVEGNPADVVTQRPEQRRSAVSTTSAAPRSRGDGKARLRPSKVTSSGWTLLDEDFIPTGAGGYGFTPLSGDFRDPNYVAEMDRRGAPVPQSVRKRSQRRQQEKRYGGKTEREWRLHDARRRSSGAYQEMAEAKRREAARVAANLLAQRGDTPYRRAIAERQALLNYVRGG